MRSLFQTREVLTVNAIDKSADQLRGIVYGAAVGDALGVPYEFMKRDSFECAGMTRRRRSRHACWDLLR